MEQRHLDLAPDMGQLEDHAYAGGIGCRAVVDVVALHAGHKSQVVVVRGVQDGLVGDGLGGRREHSDYVGRLEGTHGADNVSLQLDGQLNRLKTRLAGGGEQLFEIEAGGGEDLFG